MAAQCNIRASLHHRISALAFVSEHLSHVTWPPTYYSYTFMLILRSGQFDTIQHKASTRRIGRFTCCSVTSHHSEARINPEHLLLTPLLNKQAVLSVSIP